MKAMLENPFRMTFCTPTMVSIEKDIINICHDGRSNGNLLAGMYAVLLFLVFFMIPFQYFYYEEQDEESTTAMVMIIPYYMTPILTLRFLY